MSNDPIPAVDIAGHFSADKPLSVPICAAAILAASGSLYFLGYLVWLQFGRVLGSL